MNDELKKQIEELEREMKQVDFWQNKQRAQAVIRELGDLKEGLSGEDKYHTNNAIVTLLAGAGGDDAEDFARMLFEMYQKFLSRRGFELTLIHENPNNHGGFRNLTFFVRGRPSTGSGQGPYGILKGESGVHRLVRVSPFSAKKLRHTSFVLVEAVPELKEEVVKILPQDLKVEFSRSSGPGGQNVNKRETAVRITHLPTGLVAHAATERTQERNREQALQVLRGKIYRHQQAVRAAAQGEFTLAPNTEIEWGSQIRSYVLHPYKLVKDHRTGVESRRADEVLAGELDEFIQK